VAVTVSNVAALSSDTSTVVPLRLIEPKFIVSGKTTREDVLLELGEADGKALDESWLSYGCAFGRGGVLFVMSSVARLRLEKLARAIMPLLAAELVVLLAVVLWAPLSTAVPAWFGYAR